MRLWPRGVRKSQVDVWDKDLAPPLPLLRSYQDGSLPWERYRDEYVAVVKVQAKEKLAELRARSKAGETITLLCGCPDEDRCHRSVLRRLLEA